MPNFANRLELVQRLNTSDEQLVALYQGLDIDAGLIDAVQNKYRQSLNKTYNPTTAVEIVTHHEALVALLVAVKNGLLLPEEALAQLQEKTNSRETDIILHNIGTVFNILCWGLIILASVSAILSVGLPLMFSEPISAAVVITGVSLLLSLSFKHLKESFNEFKSYSSIHDLAKKEADLISFFSPQTQTAARANAVTNNIQMQHEASDAAESISPL